MTVRKPTLPLTHKEMDTCCSGPLDLAMDNDEQELSKEEVEWINQQLSKPTIEDFLNSLVDCDVDDVTIESLVDFMDGK